MGLLDNIKKEKTLKEFIEKELNFIEKNKLPNSTWNFKINELKELIQSNDLKDLEKAKSVLTESFESTYWDKKIKGVLKYHIIFEKNCHSIIELKKINELDLNKLREKLQKENKEMEGDGSFFDIVVSILGYPILFPITFLILLTPTIYFLVATIYNLFNGHIFDFIIGLIMFSLFAGFLLGTVGVFITKIKISKLEKKIKGTVTELSKISKEINDKCNELYMN